MPNTYTQIHIQFIFAVKYRHGLIQSSWESSLHKYITGIVQENGHKMLSIDGVSDHLHLVVGMRPNQSVASLMQDVKANSSKWINKNELVQNKFEWQSGYGAFSYSKSQVSRVATYIENQKEHHKTVKFLDEYRSFLTEFEVPFDPEYLFSEPI